MKKILFVIICSLLLFSCNKSEEKEITLSKAINSDKAKTEKPKSTKQKVKKESETKAKADKKDITALKCLSPEIHTITVDNDEMGFVYTKDFSQQKSNNSELKLKNSISSVLMSTDKIKKGESEREFSDSYFQEMEDAVNNKQELPLQIFASSARLINIGKYKFVEYIILSQFELTEIYVTIELRSTTPENKVRIIFKGDSSSSTDSLSEMLAMEAPMYFLDSGYTQDYEIETWGNKIPEWNDGLSDDPEYPNKKNFCKKLIAGTCESKTAQEIFNQYQKIIKSMKIE